MELNVHTHNKITPYILPPPHDADNSSRGILGLVTFTPHPGDDSSYSGVNSSAFALWLFPFIMTVGIFGTIFTFLLIIRHPSIIPQKSSRIWLLTLLITDFIVITIPGSRFMYLLTKDFLQDFRKISDFTCAAHVFVTYFAIHMSGWIQSAVYVERVIAMCRPLKARSILTTRRTIQSLTCITIVILALDSPFVGYARVRSMGLKDSNETQCGVPNHILPIVYATDLALAGVVPFSVMMSGSIIITVTLLRRRKHASQLVNANAAAQTLQSKQERKEGHLIVMLFLMNIHFVICNYPLIVVMLMNTHVKEKIGEIRTYQLMFETLCTLTYVNNATNWAFYTLSGSKFRRFFKRQLLCGMQCKKNESSTATVTLSSC